MGRDPAEHARYWQYLRDLERVAEDDEAEAVRTVLCEPDQVMAISAVLQHIDRRAAALSEDAFAAWAAETAPLVDGHDRLVQRLGDWSRLKAIDAGRPVDGAALAGATDWLQRKAAETTTSSAALALLAAEGRTRRVRAAAGLRARKLAG